MSFRLLSELYSLLYTCDVWSAQAGKCLVAFPSPLGVIFSLIFGEDGTYKIYTTSFRLLSELYSLLLILKFSYYTTSFLFLSFRLLSELYSLLSDSHAKDYEMNYFSFRLLSELYSLLLY